MRLSVQLYTVREHLEKDVAGTLAKIAALGIEYVELAGLYGLTPEQFRAELDKNGLKVSGSHTGIGELEGDYEGTVKAHKTLGNTNIFIPWVGEDFYGEGWAKAGARVEAMGKKLAADGLTIGYHNHDFEFKLEDGKPGLDVFYGSTDPKFVKAELDLAWVKIGGGDPAEYIARYADRIGAVHVKDYDPAAKPQWVPGGKGIVGYDAVLAAAEKANVPYAVIELDESPGDSLDAVAESAAYFKSKGLR